MKFKKFNDIENHYREKYIAILKEHGFDKNVRWIAHEKIHGANFSFLCDGRDIEISSRNNIVDGKFYHCQAVVDRYSTGILNLKRCEYPNAEQIQVYGELFGPGIQSGIDYGPEKEFMAFDLVVDGKAVAYEVAKAQIEGYGLKYVPTLREFKSLSDGLALSSIFISSVAEALYGAENICQYRLGDNDAEGFVLKPLGEPLYLNNGSRVMIKSKAPKFAEKKQRKPREEGVENSFIPIVSQYVTHNRLAAVLSKEGELGPKDFGRVIRLMADDVLKDMIKDEDLPADWKKQDEFKPVGKAVSQVVSAFLKEHLLPKL